MRHLLKFNEGSIYVNGVIFEIQKMNNPGFYDKKSCDNKGVDLSDNSLSELYRISKMFNYSITRKTNSYFVISYMKF